MLVCCLSKAEMQSKGLGVLMQQGNFMTDYLIAIR